MVKPHPDDGRDQMWNQACHDLRQPVQSLQLLAEVLAGHVTSDTGRRAVKHLRRTIGGLTDIHSSALMIMQLERRVSTGTPQSVDLTGLAVKVLDCARAAAREKGIRLILVDRRDITNHHVEADENVLVAILDGLVRLALLHCNGETLTLKPRIGHSNCIFTVEFDGNDISIDQRRHVFPNIENARDANSAQLSFAYLADLCGVLNYTLAIGAGKGSTRRLTLKVPRG
jgi:signal transduction histidine kinase